MSLSIGRKGWVSFGTESSYGVPVAPGDYIPFISNTIKGMYEKINNEAAYGIRDKMFNSVVGKKWSEGDLEVNVDAKFIGYLLYGAMGDVADANPSGSVYTHTFTRDNSNTPQSFTVINDRVTDRQYVPGASVKSLTLTVADGLATAKAAIIGKAPITTTSGTLTTASGNLYSFKDASMAFGATVSAAQAATNIKPSQFSITIDNNSVPNFRHGNNDVDTVNHGEFSVSGNGTLFFENTTDRDAYYANTKQAMSYKLTGLGIGSGLSDYLQFNLYQMRLDTFELETGLANFFSEKFNFIGEYDNANSKTLDVVLQNTKSAY